MKKNMQKRGQVSVFVIVGVVLVILVALFFFARNEYGFFIEPSVFIDDKAKPIEDNLRDCVKSSVEESLDEFGKQGGNFNPTKFKMYDGYSLPYFCDNIPGVPECLNRMPALGNILNDFNEHIQEHVRECVDDGLAEGGFGYEVDAGELTTGVDAAGDRIAVSANYDVKIRKGETETSVRPVNLRFDVPIENIYAAAVDVVNAEARVGSFEQLLYMLNERGQVIINIDKPYPDKVYKINMKDNNFEFWFAVEGERGV